MAQAASNPDVIMQFTCIDDYYRILPSRALYSLSEEVILYVFQDSPGLPTACHATFSSR